MINLESARPMLGDYTAQWKEQDGNITGGRRCRCFHRRKVVLLFLLLPLLASLIVVLYWNPITERLPRFSIAHTEQLNEQPELGILLHPEEHESREAKTQRFSWTVTKSLLAPDGVDKHVFQINSPTIEARSGDVLEVEVHNLSGEDISMHWHGLHMRGANEMDGPVGITQCAIPTGETFVYTVPVGDQAGTFWYHAHSEVHRGDGLYGGLVIHPAASSMAQNIRENDEYDNDVLLMVGDWYHKQSIDVLAKFMSHNSEGFEPCPDSLLINGLGKFECSNAVPSAPVNCTDIRKPRFKLDKRKRYRVRAVNVGSMTGVTLTIPDAQLDVITVDGGLPMLSQPASSVGVLYPAERMDMIVTWDESLGDVETAIQIDLDDEYFMEPNHALEPKQSFVIAPDTVQVSIPDDSDAKDPEVFDLRTAKGVPLTNPLPEPDHKFMIYAVVEVLDHNHGIPNGVVNRTTWKPQSVPLLALERNDWNEHQLVPWTGGEKTWVELTINNIDGTGHPFHLHGHDFYVIASHEGNGGWDYYNPFKGAEPRGGPFNLIDPLQKDTVYVPAYGYVVLRFLADHEGIWALHCHIMWHQASGMSMAFQVFGDEKRGLAQSAAAVRAKEQCAKWN